MCPRNPPFPVRAPRIRILFTVAALLIATALIAQEEPAETEPAENEPTENRLGRESSPYLRLHADDPVDWYPWGPEAFAAAREQGKPIFLSIGYSTCHWCHVMERESFSDPEIAARMNENFVNVKVDREERPDVDEVYMMGAELVGGGGGWPLSIFLTPDLEPFYAGTYFPLEPRRGLPAFPDVLRRIARDWERERERIEDRAQFAVRKLRQALESRHRPSDEVPPLERVEAQVESLAKLFDPEWGGFGRPPVFAPKFPRPASLSLLLDVTELAGEGSTLADGGRRGPDAPTILATTLDHMARGEIFDQAGGGFHRYATEREWKNPHLEKMLYDQGALLEVYARWAGQTDDQEARRQAEGVIRRTVTFLDRELRADEGFYYAAYTEDPGPRRDDKVLADWNGLVIAGLARAGRVLEDDALVDRAERAAEAVWTHLGPSTEGEPASLRHVWQQASGAQVPAYLADYAYSLHGYLELDAVLAEAPGAGDGPSTVWLERAVRLADEMIRRLGAEEGAGFFTAAEDPRLLVRIREVADGARPSPNAVAVLGLVELWERTGEERFGDEAREALRGFASRLEQPRGDHPSLARAVLRYHEASKPAASASSASSAEADGGEGPGS